MGRVIHFELPADDPARAIQFYETVFGWKIEKWAGPIDYWMITTGDASEAGIDGAITHREGPFAATMNTVAVDSVDEIVGRAEAAGGKVILPKHAIPGMGWLAYIADTEGNISGLMQMDPSAH